MFVKFYFRKTNKNLRDVINIIIIHARIHTQENFRSPPYNIFQEIYKILSTFRCDWSSKILFSVDKLIYFVYAHILTSFIERVKARKKIYLQKKITINLYTQHGVDQNKRTDKETFINKRIHKQHVLC